MKLRPEEARLFRHLLLGDGFPPTMAELTATAARLEEEAPPLGAHVFRVVCMLGTDAAKAVAANTKERRALREQRGVKALRKGEGPAKVTCLSAPTMNEYNGLDPWRKEVLRKTYDEEIETLKAAWPQWSCGVTERSVERVGKTSRCKACRGEGVVVRKRKAGDVRVTCDACGGSCVVGASPQVLREGGRRRAVVLTRESSGQPDEESLDACGGKIPVDRLVHAGVLRGDTPKWLVRYARWTQVPPGQGRVVVDVYDLAD